MQYTTEDGIHYAEYCEVCGYSTGEELHTWVYTSINALYHEGYCTDCEEVKTSQEAHSWTQSGIVGTVKCQFCGYLKRLTGNEIVPINPTKKEDEIEEETK